MGNSNKQFTDDELYMLSDGVLALIRNTNEALKLVSDSKTIEFLKESQKKCEDLNTKIHKMNEREYLVNMFAYVDISIKASSPAEAREKAMKMCGEHHNERFDYVYLSEINNVVNSDGIEV